MFLFPVSSSLVKPVTSFSRVMVSPSSAACDSLGQRVILLAVDLRGLIRLTDGTPAKAEGIIASTIAKAKTVDNILFFMYVASS